MQVFFKFRVSEEGIYRTSLGNLAWVDFVHLDTGTLVKADDFARQENCPTIKKMVQFRLFPDIDYVLQLSASEKRQLRIMIVRVAD